MRDDRQLECALEGEAAARVPLADDAARLVDELEAAVEVAADDPEQVVEATALEDGVREPLVDGDRLRQLLEPLARDVRDGRLRDRHERHLVRNLEHREAEPVGLLRERGRHLGEVEADPEAEPCETVLGEAAQVRALAGLELAHAQAGREQQLAALEPLGGVVELGDVEPADLPAEALGARRDPEVEAWKGGDVANGKHACLDELAKTTGREARVQCPGRPISPNPLGHGVHKAPVRSGPFGPCRAGPARG